jgi:hypothetical protein
MSNFAKSTPRGKRNKTKILRIFSVRHKNDVKGVTKSLRLQKDNDKKIKVKRTDNNLQNTTQKTKG